MAIPLRVLILEDRPADAELMVDQLHQAGFDPDWQRVDTEADYLAHLDPALDIILADYSLPQWDAPRALRALQERGLDIPFIMISGTVGEDVAVECIKQGAVDYLLKDRLGRLGQAVAKALEDKRLRAEKRQAEAALRESEERHRLLFDSASLGISYFTPQGQVVAFNNVAAAHMGGDPADYTGRTLIDLFGEEAGAVYLERIRIALESRDSQVYEDFVPLPSGDRWFLSTYSRIADASGEVVGVQIIANDITERKHTEEALRESEARLRTVLENMPVMLDALDENLNIIVWNRECERVTGYSADEIINHPHVSELFYPDPLYRERMQGELVSSDDYRGWEWETTCKDGSVRTITWFNISGQYPVPGWAEWGIGVDITELKRVERQLHKLNEELEQRVEERTAQLNHAKERIEAILNSSTDVMILCRTDGTIDQANPAFNQAFGYKPDEAFNQPLTMLVVPESVATMEQTFATVVETRQSRRLEVPVRYKNRVPFDADVVLSPIVEQNGWLLGVVCSLRDITQRKLLETRLRQMLEHETELSELKTRYVSMAAHDLRNPLAVILSAVDIIQQYSDRLTDEQIQVKYAHIRTNIKVMVDMLDDILTIGQVESGKLIFTPAPVDVIAFCQNLTAEAQQAIGTTQIIDFSSQGACGTTYLDARLLRHILGNLLSNALKYSPDASAVTFTVDCEPDQIMFRVQDQGIGIPEEDQIKLFETFHRASNARQIPGTGLGLAIVKQSVELHGGTITFESEEGIGTTFTVALPRISPYNASP